MGDNSVILLARLGEVSRLSASQQADRQKVQTDFENAAAFFSDALGKTPSPQTRNWLKAHLGATQLYLAGLETARSDKRNKLVNDSDKNLREALGLKEKENPANGKSKYTWAYAHLGETLAWKATLLKGQPPPQKNNFAWAISALEKATSLNEEYPWAIAHLGQAYRLRSISAAGLPGDTQHALENFTLAIQKDARYSWAEAYRAVLLRDIGSIERDPTKAVKDLKEALLIYERLFVNDPWLFYHISVLEAGSVFMPPDSQDALTDERTRQRMEIISELRENGPTPQLEEKIDTYLSLLNI